ncbi:HAD family hydrolase [Streptacidiphilus sp. PB12-B1b]|uniref:HAD family hydrolase n=1 Tax=Streptacidiphilus sp. PB12-B1b TaxID=2705012 RepID=UPI0015FC2099|nr:HAD hydrolase-like protein [Streptacidiphilus sp. PB12-B1b]QMU75328.1 HAD family hydrolase [Streptacidiphilus sp. PB12-B1b]
MRVHLVWDWNGTLFDDIDAVVAASNAAFAELGLGPLTVEQYRETYRVPVIDFYEHRMGRSLAREEWEQMDACFHGHYTALRDGCRLTVGAEGLLAAWLLGAGERTQSLLSMYGHDELVPLIRSLGLQRHFLRVDGRDGTGGVSGKAEYLVRHLQALAAEQVSPARTVLIGDALDDARAAAHAGAHAVLFTGGSHSRRELERFGVPVADTLAEAVAYAEELVAAG